LFSTLGNPGIAQVRDIITELLTTIEGKNSNYEMKITDLKIIHIANYTTFKKSLLDVD
jgi:hypothetical protein